MSAENPIVEVSHHEDPEKVQAAYKAFLELQAHLASVYGGGKVDGEMGDLDRQIEWSGKYRLAFRDLFSAGKVSAEGVSPVLEVFQQFKDLQGRDEERHKFIVDLQARVHAHWEANPKLQEEDVPERHARAA